MSVQAVGLVAGTLTTAAWIPQLTRTWRSRSAEDLSWSYLLTFAGGVSTWLVYGALTSDLPVLAANAVSAALILALAQVKARRPKLSARGPSERPAPVLRARCERSKPAARNRGEGARCTRPDGPGATERNRH